MVHTRVSRKSFAAWMSLTAPIICVPLTVREFAPALPYTIPAEMTGRMALQADAAHCANDVVHDVVKENPILKEKAVHPKSWGPGLDCGVRQNDWSSTHEEALHDLLSVSIFAGFSGLLEVRDGSPPVRAAGEVYQDPLVRD